MICKYLMIEKNIKDSGDAMDYKEYEIGQENMVSELVWAVFKKYEAPDYPEEGIKTFKAFIAADNIKHMVCNSGYKIYCCFKNNQLVGVLALRDKSHISLLFVHEDYHRQGIANKLLSNALHELMATNENISRITVNSSPYALEIYKKMGFRAISKMQEQDGIIFIPLIKEL